MKHAEVCDKCQPPKKPSLPEAMKAAKEYIDTMQALNPAFCAVISTLIAAAEDQQKGHAP